MTKIANDGLLGKIIKNSGIIITGNSTASAFNLASFTIMANQLGPEHLGVLVLCQTYAIIINDLLNIQTWESMIKYGASRLKSKSINGIIFTNLLLDFVSAIVALIVAVLLATPTANLLGWNTSLPANESIGAYAAIYSISILFNLTTFTIGIPRLFRKFLSVSIINTVVAILRLACVLVAVFFSSDFLTYLSIFLGFEILTNLALIALSLKLIRIHCGPRWWKEKFTIDKDQIKFIWWTNLRTIIRIPVRRLDVMIIGTVMDMGTLGIYKVYKEFAGLINRIGEPIDQAIFPEFAKLIGEQNSKGSIAITQKTILLLLLLGSGIFMALYFSAEFFISRFFGVEYLTLITALYWMLAFYSISFVTTPINSLFIAAGFAKYSFYLLLFTNSIYLIAAFALGAQYGIFGLIAAYAIQLFLNKGLKVYLMARHPAEWDSKIR